MGNSYEMCEAEYYKEQQLIESMKLEIVKLQTSVISMAQQAGIDLPPDKYPFLYK